MGKTQVESLRRSEVAIGEFGRRFSALLNMCDVHPNGFGYGMGLGQPPTFVPKSGREAEASRLTGEVQISGGRAAAAFERAGVMIDHSPPGTHAYRTVNPALIWSTVFTQRPMCDAGLIIDQCNVALGRYRHLIEEEDARKSVPSLPAPAIAFGGWFGQWTGQVITGVVVLAAGGGLIAILGLPH